MQSAYSRTSADWASQYIEKKKKEKKAIYVADRSFGWTIDKTVKYIKSLELILQKRCTGTIDKDNYFLWAFFSFIWSFWWEILLEPTRKKNNLTTHPCTWLIQWNQLNKFPYFWNIRISNIQIKRKELKFWQELLQNSQTNSRILTNFVLFFFQMIFPSSGWNEVYHILKRQKCYSNNQILWFVFFCLMAYQRPCVI